MLSQDKHGIPPLYLAAQNDKLGPLRLLLAAGADPNARPARAAAGPEAADQPSSPHGSAASWQSLSVVDFGSEMGSVAGGESGGFLALHAAAKKGATEVLHELLRAGAEVDAVSGRGQTALFIAASHGQTGAVAALLRCARPVYVLSPWGFL